MDDLPANPTASFPDVRRPVCPRIYLCGRLAIESGATVLLERGFPGRQGRLLWVYLVLNRQRPVGRERLAHALWGDDLPDTWEATLTVVISRLRTALKPIHGCLVHGEPGRYALELPEGAFVDLERARAARHAAETALRRDAIAFALGEARVAMEIAARGFLDGEEAPWIDGERNALHELRLHAMECTVEAELRRCNPEIAAREAEHLIAIDPLWEPGYRWRMRAAAALGNPAHALRIFEQCRIALRAAGGLEPSSETRELLRQVTGPGKLRSFQPSR